MAHQRNHQTGTGEVIWLETEIRTKFCSLFPMILIYLLWAKTITRNLEPYTGARIFGEPFLLTYSRYRVFSILSWRSDNRSIAL